MDLLSLLLFNIFYERVQFCHGHLGQLTRCVVSFSGADPAEAAINPRFGEIK